MGMNGFAMGLVTGIVVFFCCFFLFFFLFFVLFFVLFFLKILLFHFEKNSFFFFFFFLNLFLIFFCSFAHFLYQLGVFGSDTKPTLSEETIERLRSTISKISRKMSSFEVKKEESS